MTTRGSPQRVLIVTASPKFPEVLRTCLPPAQFQPLLSTASPGEAKRMLLSSGFDLLVIDDPLGRESGVQLAMDIASQHASLGILLLVRSELFDQASARLSLPVCAWGAGTPGFGTSYRSSRRSSIWERVKSSVSPGPNSTRIWSSHWVRILPFPFSRSA